MYCLYSLRSWNVPKHDMYNNCQHGLYLVRSRVDLQYDYKCCLLYDLCCGLRSRNYLSVHSVYCDHKPRLYCLYCVRCWYLPKHSLYGLGQHGMYLLRSGHNLQHDHQCGIVYDLYDLRDWNLCVHGLYCIGESGLYGLCSRNVLQYDHQRSRMYGLYDLCRRHLSIHGLYNNCKSCLYCLRSGIHL